MAKEPFDRTKPYVNIGEIGNRPTNEDVGRAGATIAFVVQNGEEYNRGLLLQLIKQYGEKEGNRKFREMILQADQINEAVQNIDDGIESKIR